MTAVEPHRDHRNKRATGERAKLVMTMVRSAAAARDHEEIDSTSKLFDLLAIDIEHASSDALCTDLIFAMRDELAIAKVRSIKEHCEQLAKRFGTGSVVPVSEILNLAEGFVADAPRAVL